MKIGPTLSKSILLVLLFIVLGFIAFFTSRESTAPTGPLGGDKDEHGCIGSAGYSWCEPKQKCLRIWEEPCDAITSFEECEAAGYPVMESYPRRCNAGGQTFTEIIPPAPGVLIN